MEPGKPSVDETLNYEKLIDMSIPVLEDLVTDCDKAIEETRKDIVQNYEQAKPFLLKMRTSKIRLKQLVEKTEAYKAFLSTGKDGSLISHLDISSLRRNFPELNTESPDISLPPSPHTPIQRKLSKPKLLAIPVRKIVTKPKAKPVKVLVRTKSGELIPRRKV